MIRSVLYSAVATVAVAAVLHGESAIAATLAQPSPTRAGPSAPPSADSAQVNTQDIVVTARKRSETLHKVPISATVVTGQAIASQGITSIQDLTQTLTSVQLSQGTVSNRQIIRGVGSGDNPSFEQSVGTFIDDIYFGRSRSSEATLFDVERVEVLKGPQTTYFGNNAIAGALNIVTRDPGQSLSGNARLLYNPAFHGYQAEAGIDLPATETLAFRVAGQLSGQDGWISDIVAGERVPHTRNYAVRGTALWRPISNLTVRIKVASSQEHEQGGLPVVRSDCPPPAAFGPAKGFCAAVIKAGDEPASGFFTRNSSAGQKTTLNAQSYDGTINYDQGNFTLTSVTGYNRYSYGLNEDLDISPQNLLSLQNPERYNQFSQEFRITSQKNGVIEYLAGAYYQHGNLSPQEIFTYGFLTPTISGIQPFKPLVPYLPLAVEDTFNERSNTYSGFGSLTVKPVAKVQITGALRYTSVHKDFYRLISVGSGNFDYAPVVPFADAVAGLASSFATSAGLAVPGSTSLSRTDRHLSRSVSVQYEPSDPVMLYARYDNGFKAGGFNGIDETSPAALLPFAPETVNAFEIGAKTRLFDNRATLNVAFFRSKYSDLQLSGVAPTLNGAFVNRVQNAGGAISQGVEADGGFRITPALRTSFSATYLDAYYTQYANATPTALQTLQGAVLQNLSGASLPLAPKWSASWAVNYEAPISDTLKVRLANELFYKSRIFLNPNNDSYTTQDAYAREDLTLSLASAAGWELSAIGKNLTNRVIKTYGASYPTSPGTFVFITEPPRSVAFQLIYKF